ncbi:hypothetical protein DI396_15275 [Litorivita pollutaquae]|uniref:DUF2971 domain-containing protein n=1 Tax=Litorivita pollutaquae TaxID=2200892 RepID=A0A2V4N8Y3_9RHOB|nr:DUF2971 domain-containing protein [Litorivita pollutaquae]PYC46493.1 hypothetical protein DI396_15275 [Litorivita pollutaquae]
MNFDETIPKKPSSWNNDRLHFFKYMSFETAEIVLTNRTLRWSTPRTLNDLYDVQFDMGLDMDLERLDDLSYEKMWKVVSGEILPNEKTRIGQLLRFLGSSVKYASKDEFARAFDGVVKEGYERMLARLPETQREIREYMEDLKVLCLTEDPTNPPMWAHYAQQDSGVVIRLRSIPALDTPYGMAVSINYLQELPSLADEEHFSNVLSGIQTDNYRAQINRMMYSKGSAWSYEKEWRISSGDGRNKTAPYEDISFGLNDLDGVILGINMSAENRRKIIELTKSFPNVELLEAKRSTSGFHHDIVPIAD